MFKKLTSDPRNILAICHIPIPIITPYQNGSFARSRATVRYIVFDVDYTKLMLFIGPVQDLSLIE